MDFMHFPVVVYLITLTIQFIEWIIFYGYIRLQKRSITQVKLSPEQIIRISFIKSQAKRSLVWNLFAQKFSKHIFCTKKVGIAEKRAHFNRFECVWLGLNVVAWLGNRSFQSIYTFRCMSAEMHVNDGHLTFNPL